jgi:predicted nucleic acid-binding protein
MNEQAAADVVSELPAAGIAGGAVYDALVGATAREHGLALATRDRRALDTYRALDVRLEVVA